MDLKSTLPYLSNVWGLLSATSLFFPYANELLGILPIPVANESERLTFATINALLCAFILLVSLSLRRTARSFAIVSFIVGVLAILIYVFYLTSPITALISLGINANITYLNDFPELVYKGVYWLIFASLTGAFTSIAGTFSYSRQISSVWR